MRRLALVFALATLTCGRDAPPPPPSVDPATITWPAFPEAGSTPDWRTRESPDPRDPAVAGTSKTFMVASEAVDATKVGVDVLAAGGNAVDAAIATGFALAVTHPSAGNLGGGGFAVVRLGPGKAIALDFREVAPAAATAKMYLDKDGKPTRDSLLGHRASGVPGTVAGMYELHRKHGKKPWRELVAPAVKLARDGFVLDEYTAKSLGIPLNFMRLKQSAATTAIWFLNDEPKAAGSTIKIPELAVVLERIAENGSDGFYKGETAKLIIDEMKSGKGIITAADLVAYKPVWREPLRFPYRGRSIVVMGPPSSGGLVLAMTAGMLRGIEIGKLAWYGPDHVHRIVEVWKRAFAMRNQVLGDPAFTKDMPIAKLMSQAYLDKLAATITTKAAPAKTVPPILEGSNTTHLCVVDRDGMSVSLTTTLNAAFGNAVTVKGAGFLLNNEMDDFTVNPGTPNTYGLVQGEANKIEPGKRMLSSMVPTIVEDDKGEVVILVGAGGGPRIISSVWQTISNVIDFGKQVDMAVARQRVHHQHLPDILRAEDGSIERETDEALRDMGHEITWGEERKMFGHITAIVRTANGWEGTADPRVGGAALGD